MRFPNSFGRPAFLLLLLAGLVATFTTRGHATTINSNQSAPKRANGRIVYQSERSGQNEIFVMDADGKNPVQLTDNTVEDSMPSFSPDGGKIVFVSRRDEGFGEIYVIGVDGRDIVRLTNNSASDFYPVWSPDGKRIAFQSYRDGNSEIYVMDADGGNQTRLTTNTVDDTEPSWSPDGTRIAFASDQNSNTDIYVMSAADGSNQTRLTDDPSYDRSPSWSPDGVFILFVSGRLSISKIHRMYADGLSENPLAYSLSGSQSAPEYSPDGRKITFVSDGEGEPEVFTMNADDTGPVRLTNNPTYDGAPSWQPLRANGKIIFSSQRAGGGEVDIFSMQADGETQVDLTKYIYSADEHPAPSPDGMKIAFHSFRNSNFDIWVMDGEGTNLKRLTTDLAVDKFPAWSPDGSKIAFTSERDGNREIYLMNADGTNQVRLTNNSADDSYPAWSVSGTQLAFQSDRDGQPEIFVINADGSGEKKLATGDARQPRWSPDGSRLAFASLRDGNFDIFVMTADGKNPVNLTKNNTTPDSQPAWSPDATRLTFATNRDGNMEIYVMNADGSNQTRLTTESAPDDEPAWKTIGVYSIRGRVVNSGVGFPGVVVHLRKPVVLATAPDTNQSILDDAVLVGVTTTDNEGSFVFNSLDEDATYEVVPLKLNYTFTPENFVLPYLNASKSVFFRATIASYTISGIVTDGQFPMAGLKVLLSGSKNTYVLTDTDGNYSFTVLGGGTYTVKPTLTNYTFAPTERVYNSLSANQSAQDFTGTLNKHTISGVVKVGTAGLAGVTMTLGSPGLDFTPRKMTTDAAGAFSFTGVPAGRTYTVTPAKTYYSFTPATRTYTGLNADQTATNFVATLKTYTIGGTVKVGTAVLPGVTMKLTSPSPAGFTPRVVTTGATGTYSFANLPAGRTYYITPAKINYFFTPATRTYTNLTANQTTANFTATLKTYSITGTVTLSGTTTGLYQVALTVASPTTGFTPRTVYTNTAGVYSITNLPAGRAYTVTPARVNYNFSPTVKSYASLTGNLLSQNYSATLKTYSITGMITRTGTTTGIATVAVTITSASPAGFSPRTVQTSSLGVYTFTGLPAGRTYTITPAKTGYTFTPLTRTVSNLSGNVAAGAQTNFTGVQ